MSTLNKSEGIALFTDGSANWQDRSGGWAWVALDAFDGILKASGHRGDVTNNQMELEAARMGLDRLAASFGSCEVLVYSDSQYVVLGAMDRTRSRNKNKTFWKDLDRAVKRHDYVEFIHVKGHNDHLYNEMCDQMAGKARRKGVAKRGK